MGQLELFPEEKPEPHIYSVAELTQAIGNLLQRRFADVHVRAEISNCARPRSGHCYLTLKDTQAQLQAVLWRGLVRQLPFELEDGLEVIVSGSLNVYPSRGQYQLIVSHVEPQGIGPLELAMQQRVAKLKALGWFDAERKRGLPSFPRRVAFVTSPTGAAIRDFLEVLRRRFPGTDVLIVPTRVQGEGAAEEIAQAIERVNYFAEQLAVEVLVVGRGGGSLEDLWAFNEEIVAEAIVHSKLPVVSAVGHEVDLTISDLVADVRALTPSEAAERLVPSRADLQAALQQQRARLNAGIRSQLQSARSRWQRLSRTSAFRQFQQRLEHHGERLKELQARLQRAMQQQLSLNQQRLQQSAAQLNALSPLAVLGRGYSITTLQTEQGEQSITAETELRPGDLLHTRFSHCKTISRIETVKQVQLKPPRD